MRARGQTQLVQSSKNTDGEIKQGIHELTIRFPTSRHIRLPVAIRAATEPWWTPVGSWQEQGNEIVFGVWFVWSVWFAWSVWPVWCFEGFVGFDCFACSIYLGRVCCFRQFPCLVFFPCFRRIGCFVGLCVFSMVLNIFVVLGIWVVWVVLGGVGGQTCTNGFDNFCWFRGLAAWRFYDLVVW